MDMLWLCCENEEMAPKKRPKTENEDPVGYMVSTVFVCQKRPEKKTPDLFPLILRHLSFSRNIQLRCYFSRYS